MEPITIELEVHPPVLPPIAVGPVSVTPDKITTRYDKVPNFGGYPTMVAQESGLWSEVVYAPVKGRGVSRGRGGRPPEADPLDTGDCCDGAQG